MPSFNLNLQVGTIDLSAAAGDSITAVSFSNSSNPAAASRSSRSTSCPPGFNYCTAVVNSSGQAGTMGAFGSKSLVADNNSHPDGLEPAPEPVRHLRGRALPGLRPWRRRHEHGNLCLAGSIGRYLSGEILSSGATGEFQLAIDLQAIPQGGGTAGTSAGQTWNFQAWFRDQVGLGSNFTDGISITFQ